MNVNKYNYIQGEISNSNVGNRYWMFGNPYTSNYSWKVDFESVKVSGDGILAQSADSYTHYWKVGISSGHPYLEMHYTWNGGASSDTKTYNFTSLSVSNNVWTPIKFEQTSSGGAITCTVNGSTQSITKSGAGTYGNNFSLKVGSSVTTIRGAVTVKGYNYGSTAYTCVIDPDNGTVGATSIKSTGTEHTFSCNAIQNYTETYTVKYNANGGSGTIADDTKYYGTDLTLPSSGFTKTGYHQTAWRINSTSGQGYALGGSYSMNAAATFYAAWTLNTYEVKFNANGGSGTMSDQAFTYGTAQNLTANAFTRDGYRFAGWATSAGGDVVYTDEEEVNNLTTEDAATVNLYAVWIKSGIHVKDNGTWKDGQVFVKDNGEWKVGLIYAKNNGSWGQGS